MDWEIDAAEKGGYEHFMFKEIMEQPQAIRRAFPGSGRRVFFEDFALSDDYLRHEEDLYCGLRLLLPCGHGGQIQPGAHFERPVEVALASEFRYMDPIVDGPLWSLSSASPGRPWTPWPPSGRPSGWGPRFSPL